MPHPPSPSCKPDWPEAEKRWTAFWDFAATDRPCIDVKATRPTDVAPPTEPASLEDKYLDPDYVVRQWEHIMASTWFGGEAVPVGPFLMGGYALGCGPEVIFAPTTVWHPVKMRSMDDPIPWHPGPEDPWRQKLDTVMHRLLDAATGRFFVGHVGQVPVNDLLELLRGIEEFLIDLATDCDKCVRRMNEMFPLWLETFQHFRDLVGARQSVGCVYGWPGIWSRDVLGVTQSDMSCMISADHFARYVMHEMDLLGERFGRLWYHVDGSGAKRHLQTLCSRSYLRCIQYVPSPEEPPNGPYHLDWYRQVQAAGRCLDIVVPIEHMEFLIRHLRPEGVILRTYVGSPEQGEELLHNAAAWAGSRAEQTPV